MKKQLENYQASTVSQFKKNHITKEEKKRKVSLGNFLLTTNTYSPPKSKIGVIF